jgi:hypothetical protein
MGGSLIVAPGYSKPLAEANDHPIAGEWFAGVTITPEVGAHGMCFGGSQSLGPSQGPSLIPAHVWLWAALQAIVLFLGLAEDRQFDTMAIIRS